MDQANAIKREAEKKHVVIVGTSFIGKGVKFKLLRFLFSATYNFVKTFCDMVRQTYCGRNGGGGLFGDERGQCDRDWERPGALLCQSWRAGGPVTLSLRTQ